MVVLNLGPLHLSRIAGFFALAAIVSAGGEPAASRPRAAGTPAGDLASRFSSLGRQEKTEAALQMLDEAIYAVLAAAGDAERAPARPEWTLSDLQASLSTSTGLLALHPAGDTVCAALVLKHRVDVRVLDVPSVAASAQRLHEWLADPRAHPYDPRAAWELQRSLIAPFRRGAQGLKRLVIVGSDCLRGLPFEAFPLVEPLEPPSGQPAYLIHRYEVSYEPTLGSRLGWAAAVSSELLWQRDDAVPAPALQVLGECGGGARGVLVFRKPADLEAWRQSFTAERDGGRRPDATALRRVKLARLRARPAEPVQEWALWLLYGSR